MRSYFARFYDRLMAKQEEANFGRWRAELLGDLSGTVVEIGAGTGANLAHYPDSVDRIVLTEPVAPMRAQLGERVAGLPDGVRSKVTIVDAGADRLPLGDGEADAVVSTLVLCSVSDLDGAIGEMKRVLRPGGRVVFFEHVAAEHPKRRKWQQRLNRPWKFFEGSCNLDRETGSALERAGFTVDHERIELADQPPIFREMIKGSATAPA